MSTSIYRDGEGPFFTAISSLPRQYEAYDFISPARFVGKLKGKVAVITGASSGLGRAACLAFAAAGADLACVARRQDRLDELVAEIKSKHADARVIAVVADLGDPSAPKAIVEKVEKELGPVDILINNAGITRFGRLDAEDNVDIWWKVLEVNLRAPVALTHAVLPSMIGRKTGVIMGVSSAAAVLDIPFLSSYSTAKAALNKFTQILELEVKRHGIRCYAVHPGSVSTELGSQADGVNAASYASEPELQKMFTAFGSVKHQNVELLGDSLVAICADERFKVLSGRYIDCEEPLDKVLEEAEKPDGGRVKKEELYLTKVNQM